METCHGFFRGISQIMGVEGAEKDTVALLISLLHFVSMEHSSIKTTILPTKSESTGINILLQCFEKCLQHVKNIHS